MQEYSNDLKWREPQNANISRYLPRKITQNDKQLSPWNNDQRGFHPQKYYQTIKNEYKHYQKQQPNHSKSLSLRLTGYPSHHSNNKISKDFIQLVKLQKRGASLHLDQKKKQGHQLQMNLVSVNLDEKVTQKMYGQTLDSFYNSKPIDFAYKLRHKQQPMKVRMLKKIIERNKNNQQGSFYQNQVNQMQNYLPEVSQDVNYHKMPKRQLRLTFDRKKVYSTLSPMKNQLLTKFSFEKRQNIIEDKDLIDEGLFCKGQIIGQKDFQSKRKLKYREFQLQNLRSNNEQNILFLQQFSSQR